MFGESESDVYMIRGKRKCCLNDPRKVKVMFKLSEESESDLNQV